ncbi:MAG: hypothetical protein AB1726_15145 [Planctomycetota bacterium]
MDSPILMNIQRIKALTWLGTLAAGGTLGWSVADFLRHKPELAAGVSREERLAVLNDIEVPPPPKNELVDYTLVTRSFHAMNWTGKEEVKPVETTAVGEDAPVLATPVASLLVVLVVQVDTTDPAGSLAFVKFLDPKLVAAVTNPRDHILRIGTRLAPPHAYAAVTAISVDGVEFGFDDAERPKEVVAPVAFPSHGPGIVKAGPDGVLLPGEEPSIPRASTAIEFRPRASQEVARNEWQLGWESVENMNEEYSKILSQELRHRVHRDPRTGQVDGIEITKIKPDSLPAQHGLSEGEVLKSINGHRVTSVEDAVTFVKNEADHTTTWVAVFDRRGREITRVYHSPPPK